MRKFRYQHAYGVILAVGVATKRLNYTAIWCEQHEDILAEMEDGLFDIYQVKTRKSEAGEWELSDEAVFKSISRFVKVDLAFPAKIRSFFFVSNTQFSDSTAKKRECYSPIKLLKGIHSATKLADLDGEVKKGFDWIKNRIGVDENDLFSVFKRMDVTLGPTERAYEDELCQRHISTLADCKSMNALALAKVREALIAQVAQASSLVSSDPSRDWIGLTRQLHADPLLLAKRITADDITLAVRDFRGGAFPFLPEFASLQLGSAEGKLDTLRKKMVRGGLAARYEMMRRRSLTAEQVLLDLATRPTEGKPICSQIENVVLGECDDASLRLARTPKPFGPAMLVFVQDRLRQISETEPAKVHRQPYDFLVGVAGLLTAECKIWWSENFDLGEAP
jgi:hypothetical protein